jgi:hypothetical protein
MKKIILTGAVLIAIATASFAQNNTTTVVQTDGARNSAVADQKGQNNQATINQTNVMTTDNKATITQMGKGNQASILEKGKFNDVSINQAFPTVSNNQASVDITGNNSQYNVVRVAQSGKEGEIDINIEGDQNGVTLNQGGDKNKADLFINSTSFNDANTVLINQIGNRNEASAAILGDGNRLTIDQKGNDNTIGTYAAGGNLSATVTPAAPLPAQQNPVTGFTYGPLPALVAVGNQTVTAPNGITMQGDDNLVEVTQAANTRNNEVAIRFQGTGGGGLDGGANDNKAYVNQLDNAEDNVAVIQVNAGRDRNVARIDQTGDARFNEAGIRQEGSDDNARINQMGENNAAIIIQRAATTFGTNNATINQPGNNNEAYIIQEGTYASNASITQNQNGATAVIEQTGTGNHSATLVQNSTLAGARLIVRQEGANNTANLTQTNFDQFVIPDLEILQQGTNNTVLGIGSPTNVVNRITQVGSNNTTL